MGIKKIARPINKAKNAFVKWLKENGATNIDVYEGKDTEWDYYCSVDAFIDNNFYVVYFKIWKGILKIDYKDEGNSYEAMSIDEFLELIN